MIARVSERPRDFLRAVLCACGLLLAYQLASEWGTLAQLTAHIVLIAIVWYFRALLPASSAPKPVHYSYIAAWGLLWLFVLTFINVLPVAEYVDSPIGIRRLWLNLPLIARALLPLGVELFFVWFLIRRFGLTRKHLSLGPAASAGPLNGLLLLLALPLLGIVLNADDIAAVALLGPKEQVMLSLDAVVGIGTAFAEELLFRGAFFALLCSRLSPFHAWIAQAMLFSLAAIFVNNPIGAMGPGLIFGLSALLTRSLLPGAAAHVLYNVLGQIQAATFTQ
jgi:membrane protease YdiL (CAAX protease family)